MTRVLLETGKYDNKYLMYKNDLRYLLLFIILEKNNKKKHKRK